MMKAQKFLQNAISIPRVQKIRYSYAVALSYSYQLYHSRTEHVLHVEMLTTTLLSDEH